MCNTGGPDVGGPDVGGPDVGGPDVGGPDVGGPDVPHSIFSEFISNTRSPNTVVVSIDYNLHLFHFLIDLILNYAYYYELCSKQSVKLVD